MQHVLEHELITPRLQKRHEQAGVHIFQHLQAAAVNVQPLDVLDALHEID